MSQTAPAEQNRVQIFDTTLRDGEQSPGISLNTQEKVEIAQQLARLGVDVIEAGFPITSPGDFEAVEAIARQVEGPVICGLSRTHKADIDAAWNAIKDSPQPRIHTFISTSDIHIEHQLQTTREDVKGQAKAAVALARSYTDNVEFSPMDATRADVEFTAEVCAIAVAEGATTVNIPDTVGYTTPEEYTRYMARLYELVPGLDGVTVSVHCHDDLGLAVANSYAGVLAGARQIECAINGIGERAGNCSLEEVVMLLRTRNDEHGLDTGIDARELARTSRMVSRLTGYSVPPNKAVVGRNAFAHESGIHQDGVLKERSTYEIMDATEVGLDSNSIVLGKHSGRHALRDALQDLGFVVEGQALNQAFKRFKEIADKKKQVTALDLEAIVSDEMRQSSESYDLAWFEVEAGSRREPLATVARHPPQRRGVDRAGLGRRAGGRDLRRHPRGGRHRGRATALRGRGGNRGHRRARPGDRGAARQRAPGQRPGSRHRHPRGLGARLRARALERSRGGCDPRGRGGDRGRGRRAHAGPLATTHRRHRLGAVADAPQADSPFWWVWERFTDLHVARLQAQRRPPRRQLSGAATIALVESVGRKSGKHRTHPLMCREDGDNLVIVASKGGIEKHPAWYLNLKADPETNAWWHGPQAARPRPRGRGRRARATLGADGRRLARPTRTTSAAPSARSR